MRPHINSGMIDSLHGDLESDNWPEMKNQFSVNSIGQILNWCTAFVTINQKYKL